MARVRPRLLLAVLAATLAGSIVAGYLLSRADGSDDDVESVSLDTPGTYEMPGTYGEPGGGIPTAPDVAGDALPDLPVRTVEGDEVTLGSLIGQPLVVNLWFSTCVPCKKELPGFAAVHRELGEDVRFVGLNLQDSPERAVRFAEEAGVGFEILLDPDQTLPLALDIARFPSTLFVDPAGRIVELHQGELTADELRTLISEELLV